MSDLDHEDDEDVILDRVDDPVCALSNPVPIRMTGELLAPGWTWIIGQRANAVDDLPSHLLWLDLFDFSD